MEEAATQGGFPGPPPRMSPGLGLSGFVILTVATTVGAGGMRRAGVVSPR